jgi:hypothetical protein
MLRGLGFKGEILQHRFLVWTGTAMPGRWCSTPQRQRRDLEYRVGDFRIRATGAHQQSHHNISATDCFQLELVLRVTWRTL